MIGIDPHKRSNTALVLDAREAVLSRRRFSNDSAGYRDLKASTPMVSPSDQSLAGPAAKNATPRRTKVKVAG